MLEFLLTFAFGVAILFAADYLQRQKRLQTEVARKIAHITAGLIVISWAFYASWTLIIIGEIATLLGALVVRRFKWLRGMHSVKRKSWGELSGSAGIIIIVLLGVQRWVFVVAMLHVSLADAAAALIGSHYGTSSQYTLLGQKKSVAGSLAFSLVSVLIIAGVFMLTPQYATAHSLALVVLIPLTTIAENVGVYGLDNLLIMLTVATVLR